MERTSRAPEKFDCVVVGGGAAGLSAGLVLGRARRRTLIVDAGEQSNLAATGIGGLLGSDRGAPAALYATGARELDAYPSVELRPGRVTDARAEADGFSVTLADGRELTARTLLLAMGMEYRYPALPGVAERWGSGVFHCPFCHGWEVSGRPLAVLANGATGLQKARLLTLWSDDVTLLTDGPADVDGDLPPGVSVDERRVAGLEGPGHELRAVRFADGTARAVGGLLVPTTMHQRSDLAARLGVPRADPNPLSHEMLAVEPGGRTSVPGVSAAGDIAMQVTGGIAEAIDAGSAAAAMIVIELAAAG